MRALQMYERAAVAAHSGERLCDGQGIQRALSKAGPGQRAGGVVACAGECPRLECLRIRVERDEDRIVCISHST